MFPGVCFGRKICVREAQMFLTPDKNIFCFRAAKFVSMFPTFSQALTDLFCLSITSHVTIPRKAFPCTVGHSYARTQTTKASKISSHDLHWETKSTSETGLFDHIYCNSEYCIKQQPPFSAIWGSEIFLHLGAFKCFVHV